MLHIVLSLKAKKTQKANRDAGAQQAGDGKFRHPRR
jgi:hypothetical protein